MSQAVYKSLIVSSAHRVLEDVAKTPKPLAVLSIDYPEFRDPEIPSPVLKKRGVVQKIMVFWDTWEDRPQAPTCSDVEQCLDFLKQHAETHNIIVQCYAGSSRSTALALAELARRMGPRKAATELSVLAPRARPNLRIVRFAEEILKLRHGALINAICGNKILAENIRTGFKFVPLDFGLTPRQGKLLDQPYLDSTVAQHAARQRNSR